MDGGGIRPQVDGAGPHTIVSFTAAESLLGRTLRGGGIDRGVAGVVGAGRGAVEPALLLLLPLALALQFLLSLLAIVGGLGQDRSLGQAHGADCSAEVGGASAR